MESMNNQLFIDRTIEEDQDKFLAGTACFPTNTATPFCNALGNCDRDQDVFCSQ